MSDGTLRAAFAAFRWTQSLLQKETARLHTLMWVNTLISTALPAMTALAVRGLVNALVDGAERQQVFFWLLVGFVATFATVVTGSIFRSLNSRMRAELGYRIQNDLLSHAARMPFAFFEEPTSRDMLQRAANAPADRLAALNSIGHYLVMRSIQIASLLLILFVIEPLIFILLVPIGVPYLLYQLRLVQRRFRREDALAESRRWIDYYRLQLTDERTVAEIKMLKLAPLLLERVRAYLGRFRDIERDFLRYELFGMLVYALASVVAIYLALTRAVLSTMAGELTIGDIAIYGSATTQLRGLVEKVLQMLGNLRYETLHAQRIREFLALTPDTLPAGTERPVVHEGRLVFDNVTFTYPGSDRPAVCGLSFELRPGETVALVGENGAGKTTIAKLIARFYDPDEGSISCNGVDLRQLDPDYLRDEVAFVLQHFGRYAATAAENLAYGDWQRLLGDQAAIERLAQQMEVADLIGAMPEGYETMLGRSFGVYDPSGGEWQQLAIARALGRDGSILILDEPTANLDVRREYELFERFRQMAQGRTTLLISHRFATVRMADRILVLDKGRIIERGTHAELMALDGKYRALYELHLARLAA